ncbi:DnaJ domain-containing protein, partial [Legionella birminghamensis]
MKSLIEKLKNDYDYYIDNDKKKLLDKLAERYSKASYYEIFGVSESMTVEDAKTLASAFKQITLKIQPDNTSGAVYEDASQKLFQIVKNAYETLSDPDKELAYKNKLRSQGEKAIRSVQTSEIEPSVQTLRRRTFFTKVSTSESAEDQVYNRDIRSGETIETIRENITINGN